MIGVAAWVYYSDQENRQVLAMKKQQYQQKLQQQKLSSLNQEKEKT